MPPLFLEMFLKRINALTFPAAELVSHLYVAELLS